MQEQSRQAAKRRKAVDNSNFPGQSCLQYLLKCTVAFLEGGGGKVDTGGTGSTAHAAPIVVEVVPL
eukprot:4495166-Prymnesium_polylepis.1